MGFPRGNIIAKESPSRIILDAARFSSWCFWCGYVQTEGQGNRIHVPKASRNYTAEHNAISKYMVRRYHHYLLMIRHECPCGGYSRRKFFGFRLTWFWFFKIKKSLLTIFHLNIHFTTINTNPHSSTVGKRRIVWAQPSIRTVRYISDVKGKDRVAFWTTDVTDAVPRVIRHPRLFSRGFEK